MAKFSVEQKSEQSAEEVFGKVKKILSADKDFKKFDAKITSTFDEAKLAAKIQGSQFKADVAVTAQGQGSQITITVDLPLLLMAFKGKIQDTLKKKLEQIVS